MGIVGAVASIFSGISNLVVQGRYLRTANTLNPTLNPGEFQRQNHTTTIIVGGLVILIIAIVVATAVVAAKRK